MANLFFHFALVLGQPNYDKLEMDNTPLSTSHISVDLTLREF